MAPATCRAALAIALCLLLPAHAAVNFNVQNTKKFDLSPLLYSLFFETEINFGSEGGLYAQQLPNYDFETLGRGQIPGRHTDSVEPQPKYKLDPYEPAPNYNDYAPWGSFGGAALHLLNTTQPFATNPDVLSVTGGSSEWGISNPGYWGINVQPGVTFNLTFYANSRGGVVSLAGRLRSAAGAVIATSRAVSVGAGWRAYTTTVTPTASDHYASFELFGNGAATVLLDGISLFPSNAVAGLFRPDLFALLAAMKPGFMRTPGGNYLEGTGPDTRWNWKKTIGQREARSGHFNSAWGYWVTDGMGLHELLVLAEALGTQSQMSIYTGYSMGRKYIPLSESQVFAQDAVDMIEYATGGVATTWGAKRAAAGHPTPFVLRRIEVGNEEQLMAPDDYPGHYKLITQAVWAKYPDMHVCASGNWGPSIAGSPCLTGQRCDSWDWHFYRTPDEMASMAHEFDKYNRSEPDVFVGEYAANNGGHHPSLQAAVAEALFMLGFETNGDKVKSSSFAPLFGNVNREQWSYNLIQFDSYRLFGLPSYSVQLMFRDNLGDYLIESSLDGLNNAMATAQVLSDGAVVLKLASYNADPSSVRVSLSGFSNLATSAQVVTLTSSQGPLAENTLDNPNNVAPTKSSVRVNDGALTVPLPAWSVVVVRIGST